MTDREAMKMALEALQESKPIDPHDEHAFNRSALAIEALRQALAQPEQEPVEPPDYVEPITFDYHDGWEAGFKAGVEARGQK